MRFQYLYVSANGKVMTVGTAISTYPQLDLDRLLSMEHGEVLDLPGVMIERI